MASAIEIAALVLLGEAKLLELQRSLALDFAMGRTVVSASFGDSSSTVQREISTAQALRNIAQALYSLDPVAYPQPIVNSRTRVVFASTYAGGGQ